MDNRELLELIDKKALFYLTIDQLTKQLVSLTGKDKEYIKQRISDLFKNGDLMMEDNNRVFVTSKRGYIKCTIRASRKGFAFGEIIDNPDKKPDIFIPKDLLKGALDEDVVLVQITNRQDDNVDGEVISIVEHKTEYVVGEFKVSSTKCYVQPDDDKYPVLKINRTDRLGAVEGDKVVAKVVFSLDKERRGIITERLGKAGTVSAEEMSIIRLFKIRDSFSNEIKSEAEKVPENVELKDLKNRLDLRNERIITIDGEDSRDFDDAISIKKTEKGYILGVHIADVSHYVVEGSAIDSEAYLRGNSVYLPDMVIPMLPERLSNGICSLREGVDRLTLSVIMELDENAKVIKSQIKKSVIKSAHRMTYTNIQAMLNGNEEVINQYKDIYEDVLLYAELSKKLKQLRYARGEIRLNIAEPKVVENDLGEIDRIEKEIQDESHELIESLMIITNEVVAHTFFSKKLPFVYRIHEKPDSSKMTKLIDTFKGLGVNANLDAENPSFYDYQKLVDKIQDDARIDVLMKLILRSMMKACYSNKCLGHFGIASTFYCHFTSPIRRYPDLLIHRIISHYLNNETSANLHLDFDEITQTASEQSSLTEKRADEVERAVDDYKKALYMQKRLGEIYTGTVSGVHDFGVFVELENTIEGLIRFEYLPVDQYDYDDKAQILKGKKNSFRLGDKIDVICVNANTRTRQIDFDLAERLNSASIDEIIARRTNNFNKKSGGKGNKTQGDNGKNNYQATSERNKSNRNSKGSNSKNNNSKKEHRNNKKSNFVQFTGMKKQNKKYSRKNQQFDY